MNAINSYHAAIFDPPRQRKLKPSFWIAVIIAATVHITGGLYLLHQKFTMAVTDTDPGPTVIIEMPPKPEPPKPTKPLPPPPPTETTVKPHTPDAPIPATQETTPIPPADPTTVDVPTPITEPPGPIGGSGPVTAPSGPAYVTARWTRFPDSDALLDDYPERAAADEVEGQATLECTVIDDKGRVACIVLKEQPSGYGFGKATVKMVQDKGRVDVSHGDVRVGSKLRATVKWTLE